MALVRSTRHLMGPLLQPLAHTQPAAAWARYYATDQQEAQAVGTLPSKTQREQPQQTTVGRPEEEWTEVFTETGQPYYWNQKTGETTEVGEPKPKTRFRDQRYQGSGAEHGPFQEGWREPLEPDKTQVYAFMGITAGILLGWATQWMH